MLEGYVHARFILGKSPDGIAEYVVDIVRARLMKDPCELSACELHVLGDNG